MSTYSKRINRFQPSNQSNQNHNLNELQETEEEIDQELGSLIARVLRRRKIFKSITSATPFITFLLIISGFISALVLPTHLLSRGTYISENALQPGQVNTYWGWSQVHKADQYADQVELWRNLPSKQFVLSTFTISIVSLIPVFLHRRAEEIRQAFQSMGLPSQTQTYAFTHPHASTSIANGTNVHATLHAPRTDGAEAMVLMASWLTRKPGSDVKGGDVNIRGVASVLALADYLLTMNLWSKDIIFLIADGYLHGTQAWLQAYHDLPQSNLQTERIQGRSGLIWAALSIDYPFHSFSHVGIFYEGINGQLPNLDLINTASNIIRWTGSCPVTIHDGTDQSSTSNTRSTVMNDYILASQTILKQIKYGILGTPSGPEGLFTPYRIDSIGLFAVPAEGPHGFHTIGKIIESNLRSLNNLLERFHQSFFLYLMIGEKRFISVGNYLFVPVLIGIGITLLSFSLWGEINSEDEKKRKEIGADEGKESKKDSIEKMMLEGDKQEGSIVWCFKIITVSHLIGAGCFWRLVRSVEPTKIYESPKMWLVLALWISLPIAIVTLDSRSIKSIKMLEAMILLLVGCLISVISVLNFALGVGLGILFGPSLGLIPIILRKRSIKSSHGLSLIWLISFGFSWMGSIDLNSLMFNDQCLGDWFLGFWLVVVLPLVLDWFVIGLSGLIHGC